MKVTFILILIGALGTVTEGLIKGLENLELRGRVGDHPKDCIIEIDQNTEKSPEDFGYMQCLKIQ